MLGVHGPGQDPLVVGVRGLLGRHDGQRPVVHLGVHALHGQVGALDQADLDLRAALGHAPLAPLGQVLHRAQGIGQVGLHDDARLQALQLGAREQRREDLGGQVQVRVDLHVQVDELGPGRGIGGLAVQRQQALDHALDGLVEAPVRELRDHGGDLDRRVVDVVAGQDAVDLVQVLIGLGEAQDLLAERVDVQRVAALRDVLDGLAERARSGVDHQVTDHLAKAAAGDRDDDGRSQVAHVAAGDDLRAIQRGQGLGGDARDALQRPCGGDAVLGADDAIDEADGEVQAAGVLQDGGEAVGGVRVRDSLFGELLGPADPGGGLLDGRIDQSGKIGQLSGADRGVVGEGGDHEAIRFQARTAVMTVALPRSSASSQGSHVGIFAAGPIRPS